MSSWEAIIISLLLFILSCITFIISIDGNGIINIGEAMGMSGILVFFFITLLFICDDSKDKLTKGKELK